MKQQIKILTCCSFIITIMLTACTKKLDRQPNNGIFTDSVYNSLNGYKSELAKVYSAFALTGSNGPGSSDLGGIDAGTSDFLRLYWNAQELSTDEAICAWNDPGVPDFHNLDWTSSNTILTGLYNRSLYQITVANAFLKECTASAIASHGISASDAANITHFAAEARFLRAYQYWVLMDLFGNPPFVTENDPIGAFLPKQITRSSLFNYVDSELIAIQPNLIAPHQNEYGRADQAADWALLSRLYLNAEVYTGTPRYNDAVNYAQKVIDAGYKLLPDYKKLFYADNNVNNTEAIFAINYDALFTQNYGGTTFLVNGSINSDMNPASFGVPTSSGWGGNRTTENLPDLFTDLSGTTDHRALFYGDKKDIDNEITFTDGLRTTKWRNINSDGSLPAGAGTFCSIDFPLFRLAEIYLTYAEAALRGGGDKTKAVQYFNLLRERAYGNSNDNVATISLQDVLDEKAREMYWEATRRTDLVRYGLLTSSNYLWPWKGGIKNGTGVDKKYNVYPIPSTDIIANPNLKQNSGY